MPEPELQTLIASPMNMVELLEVTDAFQLSGIGLTLMPDFPVPANGWKSTSLAIELLTPEGSVMAARAQFNITHFNIKDPNAGVERRWRVVATLPELHKSQVPIGTRLYLCHASSKLGCSDPRVRPNPSLEWTRAGMAPWPRGAVVHVAPRGQGAMPERAPQLKR